MANIGEDQSIPQPNVTIDQARMDGLFSSMQTAYRDWLSDTSKALDKATDLNKQVYLFYERILLIDTGTIGLSVSVTLSSNRHLNDLGHSKPLVLVAVILGWFLLLLSIFYCRLAINLSMDANRDIFHQWRNDVEKIHATMMSSTIQRMSTTVKGTYVKDGQEVDAAARMKELSSTLKDGVAKYVAARAAQEGQADLSDSRRRGLMAINCMQIGLILLGIAAVIVLVKL